MQQDGKAFEIGMRVDTDDLIRLGHVILDIAQQAQLRGRTGDVLGQFLGRHPQFQRQRIQHPQTEVKHRVVIGRHRVLPPRNVGPDIGPRHPPTGKIIGMVGGGLIGHIPRLVKVNLLGELGAVFLKRNIAAMVGREPAPVLHLDTAGLLVELLGSCEQRVNQVLRNAMVADVKEPRGARSRAQFGRHAGLVLIRSGKQSGQIDNR